MPPRSYWFFFCLCWATIFWGWCKNFLFYLYIYYFIFFPEPFPVDLLRGCEPLPGYAYLPDQLKINTATGRRINSLFSWLMTWWWWWKEAHQRSPGRYFRRKGSRAYITTLPWPVVWESELCVVPTPQLFFYIINMEHRKCSGTQAAVYRVLSLDKRNMISGSYILSRVASELRH